MPSSASGGRYLTRRPVRRQEATIGIFGVNAAFDRPAGQAWTSFLAVSGSFSPKKATRYSSVRTRFKDRNILNGDRMLDLQYGVFISRGIEVFVLPDDSARQLLRCTGAYNSRRACDVSATACSPIFLAHYGVDKRRGASSTTFWWRRGSENIRVSSQINQHCMLVRRVHWNFRLWARYLFE